MDAGLLCTLLLTDCLNVSCDAFDLRYRLKEDNLNLQQQIKQLKRLDDLAMEYAQAIVEEIEARA